MYFPIKHFIHIPEHPPKARGRKALLLLVLAWVGCACALLHAQDPDYSNVTDMLNGQRTLLQIDDLVIAGVTNHGFGFVTQSLTTKDSQTSYGYREDLDAFACFLPLNIFTGKIFDLPQQTTVDVCKGTHNFPYHLHIVGFLRSEAQLPAGAGDFNAGAVADFNQDGYDDLVFNFNNGSTFVVTAKNPNNIHNAFVIGPVTYLDSLQALAVGDFNGDGKQEIAGLSKLPSGGLKLVIYTVDPKTLAVARASEITLNTPGVTSEYPATHISIASGRFTAAQHDQLVLTFTSIFEGPKLKMIDFAPSSLEPGEKTTLQLPLPDPPYLLFNGGFSKVKTGRFNFQSQYDEIALLFTTQYGFRPPHSSKVNYVDVISVNPVTLDMTAHPLYDYNGGSTCVSDFSVGNFDHRQPDPVNKGKTEHDPNLQLAVLYGTCGGNYKTLDILNVNPSNFTLSTASFTKLGPEFNNLGNLVMTQSDTTGRSYTLGAPVKVTIEKTAQPSVVVAMPPMHIDFVPPAGQTEPKLLNVSLDPDGFNTSYEAEETSSNQSATTNTTSWSFGAKQTLEGSIEVGSVDEGNGAALKVTQKAAQDLAGNAEAEHGKYSSHSFNVAQETGVADQVWLTDSKRFNVYVYPVIGKTVCPASKPECPENERVPLTIQFSAPEQTSYDTISGNLLPWYQPPWEYGNILSYPASYSQLQTIVPDIQKLSNDLTSYTDSSNSIVMSDWKSGNSASQTASFNQNYSFETDISVSGKIGVKGFGNAGFGAGLNLRGSFGFGNLDKSSTEMGKSTGIGVKKPGTFLDPPNYAYAFTPYIFGELKPSGVFDRGTAPPADVHTFSLLRTAFVVDPTRTGSGGWWRRAYAAAPDVALNHPSRWLVTRPGLTDPVPENCLPVSGGSSQMNCAKLSDSRPDDPWLSPFHEMRGFFISSEQHPGTGPQLQTATAGEKLRLQARVHNYSLKAMPPGSVVHARFYVQPWDTHLQKGGNSILIGEDRLSPIPPFNTEEGAPLNWVLANATFDTAPFANQDLAFWVVVWMEDENGKLVPEIAGHGLQTIPATLKSIGDVAAEAYSNNVGFYKFIFHVFGKEEIEQSVTSSINLGKVEVASGPVAPNQPIKVSAMLSSVDESADGVTALFYDGDPHEGGKVFGAEFAPYIGAGHEYLAEALYEPETCGVHELFVVIGKDTPSEIVRRSAPVRVSCGSR